MRLHRDKATVSEQVWRNWEAGVSQLNGILLGMLLAFSKEEIQSVCSNFPQFGHETVAGQPAEVFFPYGSSTYARSSFDTEGTPV